MKYYIYKTEDMRRGLDSSMLWWRPNRCGYTSNLKEAGVYTRKEAQSIVRGTHGDLVMVPVAIARKCSMTVSLVYGFELIGAIKKAAKNGS